MYKTILDYGVFGIVRLAYSMLITHTVYRPARLIRQPAYIRGKSLIVWGRGFTTGVGIRLDALGKGDKPKLIIGDRVQLNDYVHIGAIDSIVIGDDVLIASKVFITDHNHGFYDSPDSLSAPTTCPSVRPWAAKRVVIGNKVWIGENVCILPGVTIGEGSIIGAGAIVTHDIPAWCIAVGNPARVIKTFDSDKNQWI
jgi:lipopolysaccharide O-acetyltransferase